MSAARRMLETYPRNLGRIDRAKLVACIDACIECDQACTACADACLSEDRRQSLNQMRPYLP